MTTTIHSRTAKPATYYLAPVLVLALALALALVLMQALA
jgi:hypothetical protein